MSVTLDTKSSQPMHNQADNSPTLKKVSEKTPSDRKKEIDAFFKNHNPNPPKRDKSYQLNPTSIKDSEELKKLIDLSRPSIFD